MQKQIHAHSSHPPPPPPPPAECGWFTRVGALLEKYHLKVGCVKVKHSSSAVGERDNNNNNNKEDN